MCAKPHNCACRAIGSRQKSYATASCAGKTVPVSLLSICPYQCLCDSSLYEYESQSSTNFSTLRQALSEQVLEKCFAKL